MTIDSASFISGFTLAYPEDDSTKCASDFTTMKTVITNTFKNLTAATTISQSHANVAHKGGNLSGNLHVKGDITASYMTFTYFKAEDSVSLSIDGTVVYDTLYDELKLHSTDVKRLNPSSMMVKFYYNPELSLSASGTHTFGPIFGGSYDLCTIDGESWSTSATAAITPPRGVYEVDMQFVYQASANYSDSVALTLQLLKSGNVIADCMDTLHGGDEATFSTPFSLKLNTITELTSSETLICQIVMLGGDGSLDVWAATGYTSLTVRKL